MNDRILFKKYFVNHVCCFGLITVIILALPRVGLSANVQTLESIHAAILDFVKTGFDTSAKLEINIGLNDNRLSLPRCSQSLNIFWTQGAQKVGNTSVGVRCSDVSQWTVYTPIKIKLFKPVKIK